WSHGVFRDCLLAGYTCLVVERDGVVCGYGILSIAAGEAHVLNLCVDPKVRSLGYGEKLLDELISHAREEGVEQVFLEVRPSNTTAIALYNKKGFHKIADRKAYYQAAEGREDASVLAKKLTHY
nr:ribosomal protein S18-alanine N-acetyltransferase [Dinoroseobacter sp.]